jgi:hypothetical protein
MTTDDDAVQRMVDIATELISQTSQGRVRWSTTDRDDVFQFSTTRASMTIEPGSRQQTFVLRVLNERGVQVEALAASGEPFTRDPGGRELSELYELARRQALEVDDVLDTVLDELRNPPSD